MRVAVGIALVILIVAGILVFAVPGTDRPAATPGATQTPTEATTPPTPQPTPDPTQAWDERIDVGGRTLFISCAGTGSPTVILEAGLGADHTTWASVQPGIADFTRVCSYDRAGLGVSAPAPTPRTSQEVVADLHVLLTVANIPTPYVLVGHSFGGLHVRLYAHQYPDEVAGIVLIDAVHEDWWARAREILPPATANDSERLHNFRWFLTEGYKDPVNNREGIRIEESAAQVRATGSLGTTPLVVLSAGIPSILAPGLPPDIEAQLISLMQQDLQTELARLSSDSVHLVAAESGHAIHHDQPEQVIQTIRTFIEGIRRQSSCC